jgi:hypothetical protein
MAASTFKMASLGSAQTFTDFDLAVLTNCSTDGRSDGCAHKVISCLFFYSTNQR